MPINFISWLYHIKPPGLPCMTNRGAAAIKAVQWSTPIYSEVELRRVLRYLGALEATRTEHPVDNARTLWGVYQSFLRRRKQSHRADPVNT